MENQVTAEALIPRFKLDKILNQDQAGRRLALFGTIDGKPSLLLIERAALPTTSESVAALHKALTNVSNLGANDIYNWYMAYVSHDSSSSTNSGALVTPDLKLNLIHPCTEMHIKKYSPQTVRVVTETAEIFKTHVRPYMVRKCDEGRIDWVFNIIEGRQEQQDIILRESRQLGCDEEGFLLLPDMNWDRTTIASLRILGLVERRDLLSLRDLRKKDVPWLRRMYERVLVAVTSMYESVEEDMLKVYMHYQPTYYHFHLHVVSVALEPNATQAVGKAFSLPNIIAQLETMSGGPDAGMMDVELTYTLGDKSELWTEVFGPLKKGRATKTEEGSGRDEKHTLSE